MLHRSIPRYRCSKSGEFLEQCSEWVLDCRTGQTWARGGVSGQHAINLEVGDCVDETSLVHIHEKVKIVQEIHTKYGMLDIDICNEKNPSEGAPETNVNSPGGGSKGCDC